MTRYRTITKNNKLSETEQEILIFFVQKKQTVVTFNELRVYTMDKSINILKFYRSLASLVAKRILIDFKYDNNDTVYVAVADLPALVKIALDLKRYSSAVLLTVMIQRYFPLVNRGMEIRILLKEFIYNEQVYGIMCNYCMSRWFVYHALQELYSRGYLTRQDNNICILNSKNIPETVLSLLA